MKAVTISLERKPGEAEQFDQADKNVLQIRVRTPSGDIVCDENYLAEFSLSRDAMLGLGTELIRAAHSNEEASWFWHLRPAESGFATQILGLYLHPASCQLIVAETDHGTLQSLLDVVAGEKAGDKP